MTIASYKQNKNMMNPQKITIDMYKIELLTGTTFLGLIIDGNLTWDEHIAFLL